MAAFNNNFLNNLSKIILIMIWFCICSTMKTFLEVFFQIKINILIITLLGTTAKPVTIPSCEL